MATEHRGLQKPRDCCGHRLEHPLSRAHPEESTDKFFPPGSPPPRTHSAQTRLEIWVSMATYDLSTEPPSPRPRVAKTQERGSGGRCSALSPPRPSKGGAAFALSCLELFLLSRSPEPSSAPWSPCTSPRELPQGRGLSEVRLALLPIVGITGASPEWRLYTVSPL